MLASIGENDLDIISIMLYVKDKHDVSRNVYHEIARICKAMPQHYQLKKRISELKLWSIRPTYVEFNNCLKTDFKLGFLTVTKQPQQMHHLERINL